MIRSKMSSRKSEEDDEDLDGSKDPFHLLKRR
jgi:hypothetical protein